MANVLDEEDEGFDGPVILPSYKTPGRILVRIGPSETKTYNHEYDVLDYDSDSAVFWINEGTGFEYWLDNVEFPCAEGVFVIEGITGEYIRGRGWLNGEVYEEDDEEFELTNVRVATEEEIKAECLSDLPKTC